MKIFSLLDASAKNLGSDNVLQAESWTLMEGLKQARRASYAKIIPKVIPR